MLDPRPKPFTKGWLQGEKPGQPFLVVQRKVLKLAFAQKVQPRARPRPKHGAGGLHPSERPL